VYLPSALDRKYPAAGIEWGWQYVFPAQRLSRDPRSDRLRRHHMDESGLQKAVRTAEKLAGITVPVGCHTFWHRFATRLLERGYDIRTVQKLLGHADVTTTMTYTHVLQRGPLAVPSPLDGSDARDRGEPILVRDDADNRLLPYTPNLSSRGRIMPMLTLRLPDVTLSPAGRPAAVLPVAGSA
jgi:hypothetical protein